MELHIHKAAAGLDHAHNKEQHQKGIGYRLQCPVDIYNGSPDAAALKILRGLREYLPYLRQLFIPCVQCID